MALVVKSQSASLHRHNLPLMLEYRGASDFDVEFIAKTILGFAAGAMLMGFILNFAQALYGLVTGGSVIQTVVNTMLLRFAINIGFTGIAGSILLVTLKARADHTAALLYHKNWLNPIATGAGFASLVWGPWILFELKYIHNLFFLAGVWMLVMLYPVVAAMWVIGPHEERVANR